MNKRIAKVAAVLLLACGHVEAATTGRSMSETSAESVGGLLVLSVMGSAVSLSGWEGRGGLLNSSKTSPQPAQAKITAVRQRDDGAREVDLVGPAGAGKDGEVRATVVFPKQEAAVQAPVTVGDELSLVPSEGGAGWIVRQSNGGALGFLTTQQTARDASSERF
jgi:hypothetical protein